MSALGFVFFNPGSPFCFNKSGGSMGNCTDTTQGIELLLEKCRNEFRRPENTDYYAADDYKEAERKFVKFCLYGNPGH
jgi:hypothetical protein